VGEREREREGERYPYGFVSFTGGEIRDFNEGEGRYFI